VGDRHNFSVGVNDVTDDERREVFDLIARLGGRKDRNENHCFCFERLIHGALTLSQDRPAIFADFFGEGQKPAARATGDVRGA